MDPVLWVLWALIFLGLCRGDVVDLFALRSGRRLSAFVFVSIRQPCEIGEVALASDRRECLC